METVGTIITAIMLEFNVETRVRDQLRPKWFRTPGLRPKLGVTP